MGCSILLDTVSTRALLAAVVSEAATTSSVAESLAKRRGFCGRDIIMLTAVTSLSMWERLCGTVHEIAFVDQLFLNLKTFTSTTLRDVEPPKHTKGCHCFWHLQNCTKSCRGKTRPLRIFQGSRALHLPGRSSAQGTKPSFLRYASCSFLMSVIISCL